VSVVAPSYAAGAPAPTPTAAPAPAPAAAPATAAAPAVLPLLLLLPPLVVHLARGQSQLDMGLFLLVAWLRSARWVLNGSGVRWVHAIVHSRGGGGKRGWW
jgi:hypothetical protein